MSLTSLGGTEMIYFATAAYGLGAGLWLREPQPARIQRHENRHAKKAANCGDPGSTNRKLLGKRFNRTGAVSTLSATITPISFNIWCPL